MYMKHHNKFGWLYLSIAFLLLALVFSPFPHIKTIPAQAAYIPGPSVMYYSGPYPDDMPNTWGLPEGFQDTGTGSNQASVSGTSTANTSITLTGVANGEQDEGQCNILSLDPVFGGGYPWQVGYVSQDDQILPNSA